MAKKVVGLKLGASRLNGRVRRPSTAPPRSCSSPSAPLPPDLIAGGEVRDVEGARRGAQGVLLEAQAAEAQRAHRPRQQPRRRPHHRGLRASTTRSSSPTPFASARRRRCRSRSTRPCSTSRSSATAPPPTARRRSASSSSSPTATSSRPTSRPAGSPASACSASTSKPSRSFAPSRRRSPPSPAAAPSGARSSRSPSAPSAASSASPTAFSCEYTRVLEWGGNAPHRRSRHRSRAAAFRGGAHQGRARAPGRPRAGGRRPRAGRARPRGAQDGAPGAQPRARLLAPVLPGPAGLARDPRARPRRRHGAACRPRRPSFSSSSECPVRVGDPLAGVSVGKRLKGEPSPAFAVPIGLGMAN